MQNPPQEGNNVTQIIVVDQHYSLHFLGPARELLGLGALKRQKTCSLLKYQPILVST